MAGPGPTSFEVGYKHPRGRFDRFAPYNSYNAIGNTGYTPLWNQPARYPLPPNVAREQTSLSAAFMYAVRDGLRRLGLADPGLNNSQAIANPTDSDPAVQAQYVMFHPVPSSNYAQSLSDMQALGNIGA